MPDRVLMVRIPWGMAGVSDPSSHQALMPEGHYQVTRVTIPGIGLTLTAGDGPLQQAGTVRWHNWQAVRYRERMKPGVSAIRQAFATVTRVPARRSPGRHAGGLGVRPRRLRRPEAERAEQRLPDLAGLVAAVAIRTGLTRAQAAELESPHQRCPFSARGC